MNTEQIETALNSTDWSGATVETGTERKTTSVHSTRLPAEWSAALEAEADRRRITPAKLMQELIIAGLQKAQDSPTITISVAALHQAIDAVVGRAA